MFLNGRLYQRSVHWSRYPHQAPPAPHPPRRKQQRENRKALKLNADPWAVDPVPVDATEPLEICYCSVHAVHVAWKSCHDL